MRLTALVLSICLMALVPLSSALSDAEIQKFISSTITKRNVTVTDHMDGTLTFNVTMSCRSPCPHFPARLCKTRDPEDPDDDDDDDDKTVVVTETPIEDGNGGNDDDGEGVDNGTGDKTVTVWRTGEEKETLAGNVNDLMEDVAERVELAMKARRSLRIQVPESRRAYRIRSSRRYSVAFAVQRAFAVMGIDINEKDVDTSGEKCVKVIQLTVNKNPAYSPTPTCVPSGMIGLGVNGRPLFNHIREPRRRPKSCKQWRGFWNEEDEDEDTDEFAERMRMWLDESADEEKEGARQAFSKSHRYLEADKLLGVALDGFPIYGANTSSVPGRLLNSSDLDQCGGRCVNGEYRYYAVKDRKFVLGCIKGQVMPSIAARVAKSVTDGKCRYAVSCNATATAGTCDAGGKVTANVTCIPSKSRHGDSSSEAESEEEGRRAFPGRFRNDGAGAERESRRGWARMPSRARDFGRKIYGKFSQYSRRG